VHSRQVFGGCAGLRRAAQSLDWHTPDRMISLMYYTSDSSLATNSLRVGMSTPYTLGYRTGGLALARNTCVREGLWRCE